MTTPTPEAIESAARAIAVFDGEDWDALLDTDKDDYGILATAALTAAAPLIAKAARVDELRQQAKLFEIAAELAGTESDMAAAAFCNDRAATIEGETE